MRLPVLSEPERAIFAMAAAAEAKDQYSRTHPKRVADTAVQLGIRLGLGEAELLALYRGALFHDIGKIFVPEAILRKPGPLNSEEEREMRAHPVIGERIVRRFSSASDVLSIVRHHHERFDGGGYPDGLYGYKIPLLARIVSVSDAHDALTSDRPYRPRRSPAQMIETFMRGAGKQWDREVVSLLFSALSASQLELAS